MGSAQWLIGFAEGWDSGIPGYAIPAACSDGGTVTDILVFTTQTELGIGLSTDGTSGDPYEVTPNASIRPPANEWVRKSLYDPTLEFPWSGPNPLVVTAGQPLWIGLDSESLDTNMLYFAVLIDVPSGLPTPVASNIGAGQRTSGARIAAPRIPRGFTG